MTQTQDPRFRPFVLDYVRRVWGAAARSDAFERTLAETIRKHGGRNLPYALETAPFDLRYRMRGIWAFLYGSPPDRDLEKAILVDRSLPPYLRLAVISRTPYYRDAGEALLPIARSELDMLRKGHEGNREVFDSVADSLGTYLGRIAKRTEERKQSTRSRTSGGTHER